MQEHIHKQYQRYELPWYDLYHAGKIAERTIEQELHDDARIKRPPDCLALHTGVVVTYARPFTEAKGFVALPSGELKVLNSDQRELHRAITDLRDQVYAHTDSKFFSQVGNYRRWHSRRYFLAAPIALSNASRGT